MAGGCGAAFPAAATVLFPICFALLAAAAAFGGGLTVGRPTGVNSVRNIRATEGRTGTRYQALTGIRGTHKMKERLR